MESVLRCDRGKFKAIKTKHGYLKAEAWLTRSGIFVYKNPDGTKRLEYRPDEEVFHPESLESLKLLPVTNDHPPVMLDSTNTKTYSVGKIGESMNRDQNWVRSFIQIEDDRTIQEIDKGKYELSCGYTADTYPIPGVTPDGQRYDAIQKNIRYNHVAIVEKGRAGGSRIFLDAAEQFEQLIEGNEMVKVKINGVTFDVEPQIEEALIAQAKLDSEVLAVAEAERDREKARADSLDEKVKEMSVKLDAAMSPDQIKLAVKARLDLERNAEKVLGKDALISDLSDKEILTKAILSVCPNAKLDVASDVYLQARFDHVIESAKEKNDSVDQLRQVADKAVTSKVLSVVEQARLEMIEKNKKLSEGKK